MNLRSIAYSAVSTALLAMVVPTAKAEVTLKAAAFLPLNAVFVEPFRIFVDKVNAEGKGLVRIDVVGGSEAVPGFEQANAVKTGVLDMANVPGTYYKGALVEIDTVVLSNLTLAEQRKSGAWAYLNRLHNEKLNAWYLTSCCDGVPFHIYLKQSIRTPDFKGLKLRVAPIYQDFFKSIGATTANIPAPEALTALERGVVDGLGWPVWGIDDFGWQKVLRYRVNPGFYRSAVNIIVNLDKWRSLSIEQRAFLTRMANWFEGEMPRWATEKTNAEYRKQDGFGIKLIDFGPDFQRKANDVYWDALTKVSPVHVPALRKMLVK